MPRTKTAYLVATAVVALTTGIAYAAFGRTDPAEVVMTYLLGVVVVSLRYGFRPAVWSALVAVLAFDFVFVPPYLTFAVAEPRRIVTFAVMSFVAIVIAGLQERVRAHEGDRMRATLLRSVSHDLRTPLAVIKGSASAIAADEGDAMPAPTRRDLAAAIVEETDRLDRLVRNLLQMTKLETGAVRVNKERHAVEEITGSALVRIEPLAGTRRFVARVPSDLVASLDAVLVEQLLVNLLENAIKHTPEDATVEIAAREAGGALVLEVSDDGEGVAVERRAHLFDGQAGLGLAICRAIAMAHGGSIELASRERVARAGATFRVRLPANGSA